MHIVLQMSVDTRLVLGTNPPVAEGNKASEPWLKVVKTGLIFTVCQSEIKPGAVTEVYIPNSSLVSNGFVIRQ